MSASRAALAFAAPEVTGARMPAVLAATVGPAVCCTAAFGVELCADATDDKEMTESAATIEMNFRFTE
jgi:hypothetical protein